MDYRFLSQASRFPQILEAFFVFVLDLIESTIKRRIALVENPALVLRGIADSEPLLPAGIEVKLHCLNLVSLAHTSESSINGCSLKW
jgi:hypothetical protein